MPGIVGLVTKMPRKQAEFQLLQMVKTLCHENFYVAGTWVDETLGVYVGWVARKGSFSDGMPLRNEKEDAVLIFSGEDFPVQGTRGRLKEQGHVFDHTGPSYLVHLYEVDPTFPACLNGRFHGLLTDRKQGISTLFNDRYGLNRVYYHESTEGFYFAAEAKAILSVRPELRSADPQGLGEFVACGCVMENRTLFKGIYILPPASDWIFRNGETVEKNSYFQPREWEEQSHLEPEEYYQEIKKVFSQNLHRYFNGIERIGASLTGGLDSRMIMAWQKPAPGSLPCYTFGGMFRDCQDVILARRVAKAYQLSHELIPVGAEFLSRFPHYAERTVYLTDGSLSLTHSPDLYLNERAREIAPVRITGNYGSEVFRLNLVFGPRAIDQNLFRPDLLSYIRKAGETFERVHQGHPLSFNLFRQAPWHHNALLALEETQLSLRSPYLDNDIVRIVFRAPPSSLSTPDLCLRLIAEGDPVLSRIRTDRGIGGGSGTLYTAILHSLLEFSFKAEYAYDYGMPQWVAQIDHILSPLHLERLFLGRHKFHHFRIWYRDVLSQYVREMLLDSRTLSRPYLKPRQVENIVAGHLEGNRNYTTEIHKLLNLELLHRLFIDPK
jgi:asparagine synthase (glutamine-hydrolysing)